MADRGDGLGLGLQVIHDKKWTAMYSVRQQPAQYECLWLFVAPGDAWEGN